MMTRECSNGRHSVCPDLRCSCHCHTGQLPVLPYAGTSGHSGSETSRERAERDDADGTTEGRQRTTMTDLRWRGPKGLTWAELGRLENWHHGQSSGVLSVLHKTGRIVRLAERRNRSAVYVLPDYVEGRAVRPYRPNKKVALVGSEAAKQAVLAALLRDRTKAVRHDIVADDLLAELDAILKGES